MCVCVCVCVCVCPIIEQRNKISIFVHVFLDIDECALDFHDCHPNATCVNTDPGFKCYCKSGFRGIGVKGSFANGRECPGKSGSFQSTNSCFM